MAKGSPLRAMLLPGAAAAVLGLSACGRCGAERPPEPRDQAVARVDGRPVWLSDVRNEAQAQGLIAKNAALDPRSDVFQSMLQQLIDRRLLADEAVKRGLDHQLATERRLAAARDRVLGDQLVETVVEGAVSENAIDGLYKEQVKAAADRQAEPPIPLAAARPQLVRFLTYDRIRDLLETLRSHARVETLVKPATGASPAPPTPTREGRL